MQFGESCPPWRRPCCNRSAAWAASARRSAARWVASSPTRRVVTAAAPHRGRRPHHLEACRDRRGARDRRAVRRHYHPVPGAARGRCRFFACNAHRDGVGRLRARRQSRVPGLAPLLGAGPADLRRDFVDQPRRDPGLVSLGRHCSRRRASWSAPISGPTTLAMHSPPSRSARRLSDTLDDVAHLHPGSAAHLSHGVSVAWKNIPYTRPAGRNGAARRGRRSYRLLLKGDGPYLFAGEHMSYITGWQEGAVRSAHVALADIGRRVREGADATVQSLMRSVPDTIGR